MLDFEFIINFVTSLVESKYGFYNEMSQNSASDDSSSNLFSVSLQQLNFFLIKYTGWTEKANMTFEK